jgi:hypothetical protein
MDQTVQQRIDLAAGLDVPDFSWIDEAEGRARFESLIADRQAAREASDAIAHWVEWESGKRWRLLGSGGQRRVYCLRDDQDPASSVVVKVPYEHWDVVNGYWGKGPGALTVDVNMLANLNEVIAYEHEAIGYAVMPCRLVWHESGLPIVLMERNSRCPEGEWEKIDRGMVDAFDGAQVSWSRLRGCLAGFDAGFPPRGGAAGMPMDERVHAWHEHLTSLVTA